MKIVIMALGTRGDIEPLLAIGSLLQARGHDVVCGVSVQFQEIVEDSHLRFSPFSKKYLEVIESETGINFMGQKGSFLKKIKWLYQMYRQVKPLQKELVQQQSALVHHENPDRIIYSMKCLYPVLWGMKNPGRSLLVLPIPGTLHMVTSYSPVLPNSKYGHLLNALIYWLVQNAFPKQILNYTKEYHVDFPELKLSRKSVREFILGKENVLYAISPAIFNRPDSWPENVKIIGYYERNRTSRWKPEQELLEFLENHKKILFITFGSMLNTNPQQKTRIVVDLLKRHRIPAILNTASGGLVKLEKYPENVYFTETVPYDWIFPEVYAVIHHGGSGTTHTALKYGCASMVIPHILDQFFWSFITAKNGLGPKGISIKKLNRERLEPKLLDLYNTPDYKSNAEGMAARIKKEDFSRELLQLIE